MVIYLVRHGETDWNRQNRLQGLEDIALNETGIGQSTACARAFKNIPVGCILSSPLRRAKVTADILAEGTSAGPVIVEQGLTERDFGKLSGLSLEEREALLARNEDPFMELKEAVAERFMAVLNKYIHEKTHENMIVVSHGASINIILSHLSGGDVGTGITILKNTCISKLNCRGQKIEIEFHNLTPAELAEMNR